MVKIDRQNELTLRMTFIEDREPPSITARAVIAEREIRDLITREVRRAIGMARFQGVVDRDIMALERCIEVLDRSPA